MIIIAFLSICSAVLGGTGQFSAAETHATATGRAVERQSQALTHPLRVKQWTADG
jgi:hypothetical protein